MQNSTTRIQKKESRNIFHSTLCTHWKNCRLLLILNCAVLCYPFAFTNKEIHPTIDFFNATATKDVCVPKTPGLTCGYLVGSGCVQTHIFLMIASVYNRLSKNLKETHIMFPV